MPTDYDTYLIINLTLLYFIFLNYFLYTQFITMFYIIDLLYRLFTFIDILCWSYFITHRFIILDFIFYLDIHYLMCKYTNLIIELYS